MTEPEAAAGKWIKLKQRADIAGEVRLPEEGAIYVPGERAVELIDGGSAVETDKPKVIVSELEGLTVAELREIISAENVEIAGATRKADLIEAIDHHRASPVEGSSDSDG